MQKHLTTARLAALKSHRQIYISGLSGPQPLALGVAYFYRGHQLYAYPACNPIEPVPFSTSKGINIVGTAPHLAPVYDPDAPGLVEEASLAVLERSCKYVWGEQSEREERRIREIDEEIRAREDEEDAEMNSGSRAVVTALGEKTTNTVMVLSQVASGIGSRGGSQVSLAAHEVVSGGLEASPAGLLRASSSQSNLAALNAVSEVLDLQQYLGHATLHRATSRMGSNTSLANLGAQSARGYGDASSTTGPALLRPSSRTDSYASLPSLNVPSHEHFISFTNSAQTPSIPAHAPSTYHQEHIYTPHDRARFLADSAPGSRVNSVSNTPYPSRPVSPIHATLHTRGSSLRQIASASRLTSMLTEDRVPRVHSPLPDVLEGTAYFTSGLDPDSDTNNSTEDPASPPYSRNKPIGTGRPRRASIALNQAYNAANQAVSVRQPVCIIHGEECDGVTVTETWKTQHAKETTGFRDLYPVIFGAGDRVIVDWAALLAEERGQVRL
jgi:hypothetical protein